MTKIRCIAVDDEPKALEVLALHAAQVPFLEMLATFRDPVEAVTFIRDTAVDLILLDINMPGLSGLQIRSLIGPGPLIIFTTAYSEYAVESYEQEAVDYLLKPIRFERFLKAALRARGHLQPGQGEAKKTGSSARITVKSGSEIHRLDVAEIRYVEKDGNYVFFHLEDRKVIARLTMQQLMELLPPQSFMQIHKSYAVGLPQIDKVEARFVRIGTDRIPLARKYRQELLERLG